MTWVWIILGMLTDAQTDSKLLVSYGTVRYIRINMFAKAQSPKVTVEGYLYSGDPGFKFRLRKDYPDVLRYFLN
jgi:hypothetical protein